MSFSFGFNNDDISDDEVEGRHQENTPVESPLVALSASLDSKVLPKLHTLESILSELQNVKLTFDNYMTPIGGNVTYRRELFDIKHQVMCEDEQSDLVNDILMGNSNDVDLKKDVYEGGFKSWECSYDAVDKLVQLYQQPEFNKATILDLGCGTALPSCQILMQRLQNKTLALNKSTRMTLILSDFNYEVLRLVTVPNLLIHWASTVDPKKLHELTQNEESEGPVMANDELLLTPRLLEEFMEHLKQENIEIQFISGSWGQEFLEILSNLGNSIDLVISSETIYSLDTLPIVAETILKLLETNNSCLGLIAAKNFYFGVGGSVAEFVNYINKKDTSVIVNVNEVNSQLKRSLVEVYKA
ncbi:histidine protein methyltransferase 1 [[Candida] anglica]|uniref:protein-histidine N-methyltransferase n=1 Tax=[Candida] anglica TaxID=148631 RepID=A0ABP0EK51_9ASCO